MVHVPLSLQHSLLTQHNFRALTLVSKWHNLRPPFCILCISVCCESSYVDSSHVKFWIVLLISLIAFWGVLITLEVYIKGASAILFNTVNFFSLVCGDKHDFSFFQHWLTAILFFWHQICTFFRSILRLLSRSSFVFPVTCMVELSAYMSSGESI